MGKAGLEAMAYSPKQLEGKVSLLPLTLVMDDPEPTAFPGSDLDIWRLGWLFMHSLAFSL